MQSVIQFDESNALLVQHSLTVGDLLVAVLLVVLIGLVTTRWLHDVIFRKKER